MPAAMVKAAPNVKVNEETNELISNAAHHLGKTRKAVVEEAMRDYVQAHLPEIHSSIKTFLKQLDGTHASAVSVLTGYTRSELDELGGFSN